MRKLLIAGNWKMNLGFQEAIDLSKKLANYCKSIKEIDVAVFPASPYIFQVAKEASKTIIKVGAQNMHHEPKGAFTGEISTKMVLTCGGSMVIIGHSERRHIFNENNEFIRDKVKSAIDNGLMPVLCIGEKLEDRENGRTSEILDYQLSGSLKDIDLSPLDKIILAYEPVWAIGTGKNATPEQAQETQAFIRNWMITKFGKGIGDVRILYGGSVKPENAHSLLIQEDIDGALIGGASLSIDSFGKIIDIALEIAKEEK